MRLRLLRRGLALIVLLGAARSFAQTDAVALAEGVELLPPNPVEGVDWSSDDVRELKAGLESLPPPMRRFPGGTLQLVLHRAEQPFGMGDGSVRAPDWTEGRRQFHLYGVGKSGDARAEVRLEKLSVDQRSALWRRRAIIHAVVERWEDVLKLSERDGWRSLNGWLRPFEHLLTWRETSVNRDEWAFSRRRGRESAAMDLVTFAEEALVPVESIAPHALPPDERVACQEFSKSHFLFDSLAGANLWQGPPPKRPHCPAFEGWARLESLERLELLFVAGTGRRAESLFGHLMFRPVWTPGALAEPPSFATVVQVVAMTGGGPRGPEYLWKGISGSFSIAFVTAPMGAIREQMSELEQRSIRRFRLNLSAAERERAMERVWEMERRSYTPYFFFTDNCATSVITFVNSVLEGDRRVALPARWLPVFPTAALDLIGRVRVEQRLPGGSSIQVPLLTAVFDDIESTQDTAVRSARVREQLLDELEHKGSPDLEPNLRLARKALASYDPRRRLVAYQFLARVLGGSANPRRGEARSGVVDAAYDLFEHSVRIERYALDRSHAAALSAQAAAVLPGGAPSPSSVDEVAARQALFEREEPLQRNQMLLDRLSRYEDALARAKKRPYTASEREAIDRWMATTVLFERLTEIQGELIDRNFADRDPAAWLATDEEAKVEAHRSRASGALISSGFGRTWAGPAAIFNAGPAMPSFTLISALFEEDLGEQRLHGFRAGSAVQLAAGDLQLELGPFVPRVFSSDLTVISYRTLLRELPTEQRGVLDRLGWGIRTGWDYRRDSLLPQRGELRAEALASLDEDASLSRFTALSLGPVGQLRWGASGASAWVAGPRVGILHRSHFFGGASDDLRVEGWYLPAAKLMQGMRWIHEAGATAAVDLLLGSVDGFAFILAPQLRLEWTSEPRPSGATGPIAVAAVTLELL